jgi:hypothetical protein
MEDCGTEHHAGSASHLAKSVMIYVFLYFVFAYGVMILMFWQMDGWSPEPKSTPKEEKILDQKLKNRLKHFKIL